MITRDYFMRMIHQLAYVAAMVLKLSGVKRFDEALDEIRVSARQLLGMDLRLLTTLSDTEFVRLLTLGDRFEVEKCVVIAELLRLVGQVKDLQGDEAERHHCYTTSLSLSIELLLREDGVLPKEYFEKVESLIGDVSSFEISPSLQEKLFRYYEIVGRYDTAENILFNLIECDKQYKAEGIRFYQRLRGKTDEELERGNLPRQEIESSLSELQK